LSSPKPFSAGTEGASNVSGQLSQHTNPGRPRTNAYIRKLVKTMAEANLGWGAPRIHGELLKLGINISECTVSRLMPKRITVPSQTWRTFLDNHARDLILD
jgi:putative transposase